MLIIPVLDIAGGVAVHAQAGPRSRYAPLESYLVPGQVGNAVALLRAFQSRPGIHTCYVADLDAIQGAAVQLTLLRELASHSGCAGTLMVDAGTHLPENAAEILSCGASEVVVGLETLHGFSDLRNIVELIGSSHVVFSLDLRSGMPILHPAMQASGRAAPDPLKIVREAAETGVSTILVL